MTFALFNEWVQSLKLIAPNRLLPLLQVTLKTLLGVYRHIWLYFCIPLLITYILRPVSLAAIIVILFGLLSYWTFLLTLAARPSLLLKDIWYFESYILSLFPITLGMILCWSLPGGFVLMPAFLFFLFFLYDAQISIINLLKTPWYAIKMSLEILPLYILLVILWYPLRFYGFVGAFLGLWSVLFTCFIAYPLYVVFMSRLYIIWIHQHYKEYYESC